MRTSARNALRGHVVAYTPGAINAEVTLELQGGDRLVAVVSAAGARELGISEGRDVVALVKAPWVMVLGAGHDAGLSARNRLKGEVHSVATGAVNAQIDIALAGGCRVTATVTREAVAELGLRPGVPVTVVIKASDVILAAAQEE